MNKIFGHHYFSKKQKKSWLKKLSLFNGLLLIVQISLSSLFFVVPIAESQAVSEQLCQQPADVVLIIDRSGSMDYSSRCDWWQFKCVNPPSCSKGYEWIKNTTYDQTQSWCNAKNQPAPHQSVYLSIDPKKITAAKDAATKFVNLMGTSDQSALISYATTVSLDKGLSTNHPSTQTAINGLITGGATNIGDALKLGIDELKSTRANPHANHVMILLTDGLANKPYGPGYGEYPADVAYAEDQATAAAALGYKIFTIGLGENGEINETMLQNIAATTGANYYHSPSSDDLQAIYDSIAWALCQYGSASGCVYHDQNNNGQIDSGEPTLSGWDITLTNGVTTLTQTLTDGCYTFAGLSDDSYTVSEIISSGWQQTYPISGSHQITIAGHNNLTNLDFANYLPVCGNQILDANEICELGDNQICTTSDGYQGNQNCNQTCNSWSDCVSSDTCGDGIKNGSEQCDNTDGVEEHYLCTPNCTLEYIPWCGDNIKNGSEQCDNTDGVGEHQICSATCTLENLPYCGDGLKNNDEECDGTDGVTTGYYCTDVCHLATNPVLPICGNGVLETGEFCDDGLNNGTYGFCNSTCTAQTTAICGNSIIEGGEICDNGANNGEHQICSATCTLNAACNNGLDDDDDTLIDDADPGCHPDGDPNNPSSYDPTDNDETDMTPDTIQPGDIIINELMWMGSNQSIFDEWLELKNMTSANLDLSACHLTKKVGSNTEDMIFASKFAAKTIAANDYFVVSNYNKDNSLINIDPNIVDNNITLANSNLQIKLYCDDVLIDTADDGASTPLAGENNGIKKSMSRRAIPGDGTLAANWCTATTQVNWDNGATEQGTPGAPNACPGDEPPTCDSSISGKKYNGNREANIFLKDWQIELYDHQQILVATTTTDLNGRYVFENLCPGTYAIKEVNQIGWQQIFPLDQNEQPTFYTDIITDPGTQLTNRDFSNIKLGLISGYKYEDKDGEASTKSDWLPKENWTIFLFTENMTKIATTTTDSTGKFVFNNLNFGNYILGEDLPSDWIQFKYPTTTITILNGTESTWDKNDFVNYYQGPATYCGDHTKQSPNSAQTGGPQNDGYEQCDGTDGVTTGYYCTESCVLAPIGQPNMGSISGYKYQDLDNDLSTTEYLAHPVADWTINLFNTSSTSTPLFTTKTNTDGYYEFLNLPAGSYNVAEFIQIDWQPLSASDTPVMLAPGANANNNNFVNYYTGGQGGPEEYCGDNIKNNNEQCDGSDGVTTGYRCTATCLLELISAGGGGGGGGSSTYCGDGVVNGTEQCENNNNAPAGYYCNNCAWVPSNQPDYQPPTEESTPTGGGEIAGEETTGVGGEQPTGPLALGPTGQSETAPNEQPTTPPGTVEGEKTMPLCATCDPLDWLLIILLLALISLIYWSILKYRQEFKKTEPDQQTVNSGDTNNQLNQPTAQPKNNWINLGWLGIGLLTALVYLILKNSCRLSAPDWLLIAILVNYLLLLIVNFFIKERKHWWRLFGLLLALMPVIVFIWCHPWLWWVWLIVIIVYLFIMAIIFANWISHRYGHVAIYLSLFLLFVIYLLSRCFC